MAKSITVLFGLVLLATALLPMVWGGNPLVGPGNTWFRTDFVHDLVHLVTGFILLLTALFAGNVLSGILKLFGVVYLAVAALGLVLHPEGGPLFAGIVDTNTWDHWLHLILGIALIGLGFLSHREADTTTGLGSSSMRI